MLASGPPPGPLVALFLKKESESALVTQSCLTLCVCSLPSSSIYGILQARILEWVAISFSGDLSNPGIEPTFPTLQAESLPSEPQAVGVLDNHRETTILEGSGEK